jgi:hypothetical protein
VDRSGTEEGYWKQKTRPGSRVQTASLQCWLLAGHGIAWHGHNDAHLAQEPSLDLVARIDEVLLKMHDVRQGQGWQGMEGPGTEADRP